MIQESQEKHKGRDAQGKSLGPEPAESGLVFEGKQAHGNPEPLVNGIEHTKIRISKTKKIKGDEDQVKIDPRENESASVGIDKSLEMWNQRTLYQLSADRARQKHPEEDSKPVTSAYRKQESP